MINKIKILYYLEKLGSYQLDGIHSKIESRRAQIFNFSILLECIILLVNAVRHFAKNSYYSTIVVSVTFLFYFYLFLTPHINKKKKYVILITSGLVVTFAFTNFIDKSKDIIQVNFAILLAIGLFLSGKRFYLLFFATIIIYYITFFNLEYHKIYNPLGSLTFIGLTIMMRLFVKDAEENEKIIDKQVEELKSVDKQKTRLFSNISHEIRTPLTLILGANEQLHEIKENQKLTSVISNNSKRMLQLVNQILELSKIEAKQRKIKLSKVILSDFLNSTMQSFEVLSKQKEINFSYTFDKANKSVYIDEDALSKIIFNLLSNAFKFSDTNDSIKINIKLSKSNYLEIYIIDTGKGISDEELPYIFNQYFHSSIGLEASSGIGLALVKELVTLLGGTISVHSRLNIGTTFIVKLPAKIEQYKSITEDIEIIENEISKTETINSKKNNSMIDLDIELENHSIDQEILLIVEDNDELREFISEIAWPYFKIYEAKDGLEGIEMAKKHIPDLILSDVMMPNMDGFEMLDYLKKDVITSHIPIILLTAKTDEQDVIKGLELNADDYILKPFSKKELLLRLTNKINYRNKIRKQYQNNFSKIDKENIDSIEDLFLIKIQEIVLQNITNTNFTPDELAKEIGLSTSQLFRKLKALTNISASIYIRNIRLEEAKKMLIKANSNISEIAYDTGFSSINYFSKCFKEYTGLNPKDYNKKKHSN